MMKETTDRAKKSKCVRFNDNKGLSFKINKGNFPDESRKEMYYYAVKYVEQVARGCSPTIVATKENFQKFREVSEGLKLEPLTEDFEFLPDEEKREALEKLIDKVYNELAAAMALRKSEVTVAWSHSDYSQGWPHSRPPAPVNDLVLIFSNLHRRTSAFPEQLPMFEWLAESFRSFLDQLETLEGAALEDDLNHPFNTSPSGIYAPLVFSAYENPQNVTGIPEESVADEFWSTFPTSPEV